ncbi:hypothetical protein CRUP_004054, partial [Coryphaenoides rupestris]
GDRMTDQRCPIPFPDAIYRRVRKAKVEEKLVFIRDSLREVIELYRHGNLSSVSWDQNMTERFLITMDRQAREINSCGGSAASWELIRKESKEHLEMLDFLQASIPRPGSG